ncbi:MAG TPA: methyltransferase domain-containing protein [Solirubrobacteraceae bacterium]|jgi:SAM-dependent methyltransferase|nr:methyltransferase domain-containing protein [Solirubrobacteraceae bacterium]
MPTPDSSNIRTALQEARRRVGVGAPDCQRSLEHYAGLADTYHVKTVGGNHYRRQAVARLAPVRGEVILDVGCGTGLNFARIEAAIGPSGRLVGLELNPRMLDQARERIEHHGWSNVQLIQADAADDEIQVLADGALMCAVHDVMRSPAALANVVNHVRDGGRIIAAGPKWVPWRGSAGVSMNFRTWRMNRGCVTTFEGFARPWSHLEPLVNNLVVDEVFHGGGYIACGIRPPRAEAGQLDHAGGEPDHAPADGVGSAAD